MFFGMSRKRRSGRGYLRSGRMHSFLRSWFITSYYLGRYGSTLMCLKGLTMPHLLCRFRKAVHSPCMDLKLASLLTNMISLAQRGLRNGETKPYSITKDRMETNFFSQRLDRQRHAWVHTSEKRYCQYCRYVWANELDEAQKLTFKHKRQNKMKIIRCLVCNVNLCNWCDHEFHGMKLALPDV
jgi:hypothetical protein